MTTPIASSSAATPATSAAPSAELQHFRKVAQQFEAVFVRQMIGSMRQASGSDGDGLFDNEASKQFRDMGDAKLADQMAGQGALHVADMLVKQYGARLGGSAK